MSDVGGKREPEGRPGEAPSGTPSELLNPSTIYQSYGARGARRSEGKGLRTEEGAEPRRREEREELRFVFRFQRAGLAKSEKQKDLPALKNKNLGGLGGLAVREGRPG